MKWSTALCSMPPAISRAAISSRLRGGVTYMNSGAIAPRRRTMPSGGGGCENALVRRERYAGGVRRDFQRRDGDIRTVVARLSRNDAGPATRDALTISDRRR